MINGQFDVKEKIVDDKYLSIHNGLKSAILNDGTLCWWSKLREMLVGSGRMVKILLDIVCLIRHLALFVTLRLGLPCNNSRAKSRMELNLTV